MSTVVNARSRCRQRRNGSSPRPKCAHVTFALHYALPPRQRYFAFSATAAALFICSACRAISAADVRPYAPREAFHGSSAAALIFYYYVVAAPEMMTTLRNLDTIPGGGYRSARRRADDARDRLWRGRRSLPPSIPRSAGRRRY